MEPRFLFVANGGDPATVIRGNEEVLVGRLTDAEFAFTADLGRGIEAMAAELDRVSFLEGSGSIADKTARVRGLTHDLCGRLHLDSDTTAAAVRAAELAKADLVSSLVGEFSDLEGYAGAVYARRAGVDEQAATAIEEHHLPYGFAGPRPASDAGAVVSIADKADTLAVAFGLDLEPDRQSRSVRPAPDRGRAGGGRARPGVEDRSGRDGGGTGGAVRARPDRDGADRRWSDRGGGARRPRVG